ncbi:glycerate kinase [Massilia sp. PAMC28688]|uniref:glycerate kinase type-2 family protein n=1 Tax=Massilia sp. PAMC28688 TaxID=2861283 RepID=UPI001C62C4BB|nr:glycerate kinase [Massilia sp. PAMC28688]QYF96161.1 glycerate kinase [Massilia sp. PAMC28688]
MTPESARQFLRDLHQAALAAVSAAACLPPQLPPPPAKGRTIVIGAGKAAAAMARCVEEHWPQPLTGLVVTRYGHGVPCRQIEVIEAAHPVPDGAGVDAAQRILAQVQGLGPDDLVLCLLSGGGSALLALPAPGITLAEKQEISRALLRSGAAIGEINCVRKHLSAIKGGRLALACAPARVATLVVSDVPGDDAAIVASGPTLPDASTCADALAILARYGIAVPASVAGWLASAAAETPKPGDLRFAAHGCTVVARASDALEAAAAFARAAGITPYILSDAIEGEAREVAKVHAALAREVARRGRPFGAPCVILSGGETSVTVRGNGRGGRNAEFMLALAMALDGQERVYALACDTDGIDGSESNAGAIADPATLARAQALGLDAGALLHNNDAYRFFDTLGELIYTGPTRTNVNDLRAILVLS